MRRILLALAGGVGLFTIVAFAASLAVSSGGLQSGSDSVICDANGVDVKYQDSLSGPNYDQATLYGVDCPGTLDVTVDVQDAANATVAYGKVSSSDRKS